MEMKKETEEANVLTTKDDEIIVDKEIESISKDDIGDLEDIIPDIGETKNDDSDESGIDKASDAEVVVSDEEDFTYEKTPVVKEPEDVPSWKEVKMALRRLASRTLSATEFSILQQSFPKIYGDK